MSLPIRVRPSRGIDSTDVFCVLLVLAIVVRLAFSEVLSRPAVSAWTAVFAALCVQAAPYLMLGIAVSTLIAVFVPPQVFQRALPSRAGLAVPVAGLAGAVLPGCECGSVPIGASLMRRGVPAGPALAFVLAAPAINPVVLVATAVAFPHRPEMVLGRFLASLVTAVLVGWLWLRVGRTPRFPARFAAATSGAGRWSAAREVAVHDLAQALGLLVVGAAAAATVNVLVPPSWIEVLARSWLGGIAALAVLAVLIAICSEADAFVVASFVRFSPTAQLAFLVVGPVVDLKLIAMQIGTFGPRVAARLAPLSFVVAVLAAIAVGELVL